MEAEKSNSQPVGKRRTAHTAGLDQPARPVGRVAPKVTPAQVSPLSGTGQDEAGRDGASRDGARRDGM